MEKFVLLEIFIINKEGELPTNQMELTQFSTTKDHSVIFQFTTLFCSKSRISFTFQLPAHFSDKLSGSSCSGTGYFEVDNSKTWSKTINLNYRSSRSCWWYIYNPNPKRQMVLTVDDFHVSHLILANCKAN